MSLRLIVPALAVSVFLHVLAFGWIGAPEEVILQGGAPAMSARLGNSFEDLATGTVVPVIPEETEVTDTEVAERVNATETTEDVAPNSEQPVHIDDIHQPKTVNTPPPAIPELVQSGPPEGTVASPVPSPLVSRGVIVAPSARDVDPTPTPTNAAPATVTPAAPVTAALTPPKAIAPSTEAPAPTPSPDTLQVIEGESPSAVRQADADTPRPVARPERPTEQPRRQPTPQQAGNAAQDAVRGSNEGRENATANSSSQNTQPATQSGNSSAASNYGGVVSRRINRVRMPRDLPSGRVIVEFRIASNGSLSWVRVGRSSGNQRLDAAAMRAVQRAAPFPPPPPGAQTGFRYPFDFRR